MRRDLAFRYLRGVGLLVVLIAVGVTALATREQWLPWLQTETPTAASNEPPAPVTEPKVLKLSPQARKNLDLVSKPVTTQDYWRTIQIPGVIVDRPGLSDRGVTSPAVGVVTQVHAFAGDTVEPGQALFTLRLFSEYLQSTQSELFKATRETQLIKEERDRIDGLAKNGTIAGSRLIELDQRIRRQDGLIQAYRQDLLTRGLAPEQIEQITAGKFVSTIEVVAPPAIDATAEERPIQPVGFLEDPGDDRRVYEVQELKVELGQQVQAGQLLSVLSNHRLLYIEGHAFKQEAPQLEQAAQHGWPIEVDFAEDDRLSWPPLQQEFHIRHLSNTIDPASRTFDFFLPLTNQSRTYQQGEQMFVVWRLRPGQRVRLHVPVEQMKNVVVLPAAAVVREGPEAYVFRQNGDLFNRIPVHVLHEDRTHVVLASDGQAAPGFYLAQGSAASLNRVLKAQAASGVRADVHVHADGTVHAAH
ncbi:efflux RND transporter periplasmic adaptor subunit [Lignipirellula cremea]|uniref:Biotin-requiring enzyme n=1 Tax=Lignipirellula cremea TaxID=2528010 RepID=A0A518DL49_9BACT|nr:efflux RND transporter periplasmic adaptor subunit [Lignipirellula cremea]QDU92562.1 Biotin-requiring enzyme [Lignipirellula cremea]